MLYAANYLVAMNILLSLCVFTACKSDDEDDLPPKTDEEVQVEKLSKTWIPGTVKRDGVDVTGEFSGFALTFTQNKTYTSVKGGEVFPASGAWEFASGNVNRILRDDGIVMEIAVSAKTLNLQFQMSVSNGMTTGTPGDYEFDLITQ